MMTTDFNPFSLNGKTILIVGASSGIGQATAIACSKLGANVIALGRNEDRLIETMKSMTNTNDSIHRYIIADILNTEDINKLVSEVPSIDGLMLSAGRGLTLPMQYATRDKF